MKTMTYTQPNAGWAMRDRSAVVAHECTLAGAAGTELVAGAPTVERDPSPIARFQGLTAWSHPVS